MENENGTSKNSKSEDSYAEKTIPNPKDMMDLMMSMARFHQQVMWQMSEVMGDMMSITMKREHGNTNKPAPFNRAMTDLKDAIDGATDILQQGGKPR